jgi:hypothetical protein
MVTTVHGGRRRALTYLSRWLQAIGLVYLVVFGFVLLGAAVTLTARGTAELMSWIAGLVR